MKLSLDIQKIYRRSHGFVLFVLLFGGAFQPASAQQWKSVTLPPTNLGPWKESIAPYFLSPQYGFVYFIPWNEGGTPTTYDPLLRPLLRSTDSGKSWLATPFPASIQQNINQLYFISPSEGFAACGSPRDEQGNGIYRTMDSGMHWTKISQGNSGFISVYAIGESVFGCPFPTNRFATPLYFTNDVGKTWDSLNAPPGLNATPTMHFTCVCGNKDSIVAAVAIDSETITTFIVYSLDDGLTWLSQQLDTNKGWTEKTTYTMALHCLPHSCRVIRSVFGPSESDQDYFLLADLTPGSIPLWHDELHRETGEWVVGNSCALYLSSALTADTATGYPSSGILRSTDQGVTWDSLGSPSFSEIDDWDWHNLSVVGYGATIYAGANFDSLWMTENGIDSTLSIAALAPRLFFDHMLPSGNDTLVTSCNGGLITVIDQNLSCAITSFQNITIDSLQPSEYTVVRTHHAECQNLPDTTLIAVRPAKSGIRNITVHAHYMDDEYAETDTSFTTVLDATAAGGKPGPDLSVYVKEFSFSAPAGDTIDVPIYLSGIPAITPITLPGPAIEFLSLSLNTDLLTPIGFRSPFAGVSGTISNLSKDSANVTVTLVQPVNFTGVTQLGTVRCVVRVTDTTTTLVRLVQSWLTDQDTECVTEAIPEDQGMQFTLAQSCVTQSLMQFMKFGTMPQDILSITPNPASNEIDVLFREDIPQPLSYELIDALGNTRLRGITQERNASLDATGLSPGIYFFRATTDDGFAVTRKVVVEH